MKAPFFEGFTSQLNERMGPGLGIKFATPGCHGMMAFLDIRMERVEQLTISMSPSFCSIQHNMVPVAMSFEELQDGCQMTSGSKEVENVKN